ncbi:hypothetical protein [Methanolobus psychrotolerans]|uniref:hypothetical protein n=1 Tax=Methanolobus psychrotolerans TaxID=1874706 RepID=UPI000B91BF3D|nr:hypothetical protein [Methanolobus psychrotolerans]
MKLYVTPTADHLEASINPYFEYVSSYPMHTETKNVSTIGNSDEQAGCTSIPIELVSWQGVDIMLYGVLKERLLLFSNNLESKSLLGTGRA